MSNNETVELAVNTIFRANSSEGLLQALQAGLRWRYAAAAGGKGSVVGKAGPGAAGLVFAGSLFICGLS